MAGVARVIPVRRHFVVDTGYLDDLYSIDGRSREDDSRRVKDKFRLCIEDRHILYVPFPVLFELGRHIVEVKSATRRQELASDLRSAVLSSCQDREPWVIPGTESALAAANLAEALVDCCNRFAETFATQGETLADVAVIREAEQLKERFAAARDRRHQIHIWTRDRAVKAHEPHREDNPFV